MQYKSLTQLLTLIDEPNRSVCVQIFNDNKVRFEQSPGSLTKHQAWPGGYIHHLEETMNIACELFPTMSDFHPLDFTLSDALLVLFLHDLEKPFKYVEPKQEFNSDTDKVYFIKEIISKYNVILGDIHKNALQYIHGEGNEYHRTERIQKPLAAFVHICDVSSARIWFDFPKSL